MREQLAACGTGVYVNGLVPGEKSQLWVSPDSYTVTDGQRQRLQLSCFSHDHRRYGSDKTGCWHGFTPWFPDVIVKVYWRELSRKRGSRKRRVT